MKMKTQKQKAWLKIREMEKGLGKWKKNGKSDWVLYMKNLALSPYLSPKRKETNRKRACVLLKIKAEDFESHGFQKVMPVQLRALIKYIIHFHKKKWTFFYSSVGVLWFFIWSSWESSTLFPASWSYASQFIVLFRSTAADASTKSKQTSCLVALLSCFALAFFLVGVFDIVYFNQKEQQNQLWPQYQRKVKVNVIYITRLNVM